MGIISSIKNGATLLKTRARLKEDMMHGNILTALYVIASAFGTALVAKLTLTCPSLLASAGPIISAAIGGGVAFWLNRPANGTRRSLWALVGGCLTAAVGAGSAAVEAICGAGFVAQVPTIAAAAFFTALGVYLKSPRQQAAEKALSV